MAWGKERLIAENAAMTRELELLRDRIQELQHEKSTLATQLMHTQQALIAKESPEAYRDQQYDKEQEGVTSEQQEQTRQQMQRGAIATQYLNEMESSLFKSPEDMIQMLTRSTGVPLSETTSLHGNDES